MAKLGEGDPRWIVQDRQDGKNVNAWHWTERDVSDWGKARLRELLENGTVVSSTTCKCKTSTFNNCDMDVTIYNRKGKITFTLDCNFSLAWQGEMLEDQGCRIADARGKLVCPEIDHDSDTENLQVDVTVGDSADPAFLEIMRSEGRKFVRSKIAAFFEDLRQGHGVQNKSKSPPPTSPEKLSAPTSPSSPPLATTTELKQKLQWRVPPAEMWDVLTNEAKASAYTRSAARIALSPGGAFSFLGGSISGNFVEIVPQKVLCMKWRLQDWSSGHYSDARITLDSDEQGTTTLSLVHTNIPAPEVERTKQGWVSNFWEPIKLLFGFGYSSL
eukprot:RCo011072